MNSINNTLQLHGYSEEFLKDHLSVLNLEGQETIWQLTNSLNDPYIFFIQDFNETKKEFLESLPFIYPTVSMILSLENSKIDKIQIRNYQDNSFTFANEFELPKKTAKINSLLYGDSTKGYKSLKPIKDDIENLFFEAHSIVRDIDGLHPDQALDEICKFIYAKLFDEEDVRESGQKLVQKMAYSTVEEAASIVRSIYKKSVEYDERVYSLRVPKYKKSRGVFNTYIKLSSPAIYKLIELFENIDLSNSKMDVKGRAFQKMLIPAMRAGMGQYFTPLPIIKFIVEVLSPNVDDLIIDPFSGSGHFLTESLNYVTNNGKNLTNNKSNEFKFHKLHGIEKSERMVRISMTDMRLHGDGHSNIRCTDALLSFDNYEDLKEGSFDLVMSNPPFGSILSSEAFERLDNFELVKGRKNAPLEILGLERCIQLLRPGGKFGIVLPESIITNSNTKYVRKWLLKNVELLGIVGLPLETFSPFGANIKTIVLFGRKKKAGQVIQKDNELFIGKIESVGYDFKGKSIEKNDINVIKAALKELI